MSDVSLVGRRDNMKEYPQWTNGHMVGSSSSSSLVWVELSTPITADLKVAHELQVVAYLMDVMKTFAVGDLSDDSEHYIKRPAAGRSTVHVSRNKLMVWMGGPAWIMSIISSDPARLYARWGTRKQRASTQH